MNHPHSHDLRPFVHAHAFGDAAAPRRERALWWVTVITLVTMVLELVVGYWSGSLALVADGWHMGTHALALGGAALAAHFSRRVHGSERFAFGGWKIEVLAAYSSGLLLLAVSVWIAIDAVATLCVAAPDRLPAGDGRRGDRPAGQRGVRLAAGARRACARPARPSHRHIRTMLTPTRMRESHGHAAHPRHGSRPRHHDHNYRAATLHVLADALTSVLAIVALGAGLAWGWRWLDPVVALAGGALIAHWALGVLRDSARSLVDASPDLHLRDAVRGAIETDGDAHVADLHVWQVGPAAWSAVLSVVADRPLAPETYRARLHDLAGLQHVTIEVHQCRGEAVASHR